MVPVFLQPLLAGGLTLLTNAVLAKGKDWLKDETGIDVDKASLSPEELEKLREYELEHEDRLMQLKFENNKLDAAVEMAYLADVGNARSMQISALQQDDLFSKRFVYGFAITWSLFAAVYIASITFMEVPKDNVRFADTILGVLVGTVIGGMFNFFFGSSKGSQMKDETINNALRSRK